jgi:pimeloyl-ACP methyl ester carboxylesterase
VTAHTRFGWREDTPEDYRATTVDEQAEDAARALTDGAPPVLCGAGLGAVVALDLLLGRPELVTGAVLIEPPLLAFPAAATEALSEDRVTLRETVNSEGSRGLVDLCLRGGLSALAPGIERLPAELTTPARERPVSLFAELGAVPAWSIPFARLAASAIPARVVVSEGTPPLVREACESLAARLGAAELSALPGRGPAQLDAAPQVAPLVEELSAGAASR